MGKGVLDADDEHFLFTAGLNAQNYPAGFFGRADLVVCVGYDMVEWAPSAWNPAGERRIICIDTVTPEIDAHYVPEVELVGDLTHIIAQLGFLLAAEPLPALEVPPYHRAFEVALDVGDDDDAPVKPQRVLRDLRELMAADDILVSDVGAHKLWVARFWEAGEPNTVLISNGFAAMGFGLPAAIAAALTVRGARKVVAIVGDGGFLMNVGELETAKRLGNPLVVLVWTDGSYGLIEMHQRRQFGHVTGTRFGNPDFVALARAFGLRGLSGGARRRAHADAAPGLRRARPGDRRGAHRLPRERQAGHRPLAARPRPARAARLRSGALERSRAAVRPLVDHDRDPPAPRGSRALILRRFVHSRPSRRPPHFVHCDDGGPRGFGAAAGWGREAALPGVQQGGTHVRDVAWRNSCSSPTPRSSVCACGCSRSWSSSSRWCARARSAWRTWCRPRGRASPSS